MSKVFIFGCGYLGMRLADALIAGGYEVGALTKNETFAKALKARGITEVIVDRLESDSWHSLVGNDYTKIINCVSSAGNGLSGYESSYYEGQASIYNGLNRIPLKRLFIRVVLRYILKIRGAGSVKILLRKTAFILIRLRF